MEVLVLQLVELPGSYALWNYITVLTGAHYMPTSTAI